jgi:hypothetical protein
MFGSRAYIEICSTEFNAIPAPLFPFHCGKNYREISIKEKMDLLYVVFERLAFLLYAGKVLELNFCP